MKHLPAFGRRAELYELDGVPISLDPDAPGVPTNLAWDVNPPRAVDPSLVRRHGTPLAFDAFVACVALSRARHPVDAERQGESRPADSEMPSLLPGQPMPTQRTGWTVELLSRLR